MPSEPPHLPNGNVPEVPPSMDPPPRAGEGVGHQVEILRALRRIMRAVDLHSRRLLEEHGLSGPQLATLGVVAAAGRLSPAAIAEHVHLSRPTVTGIVSRLEARGLVSRAPSPSDRRSVWIELTDAGRAAIDAAPPLLQETFARRLAQLEPWERTSILSTLQRIASMMDAVGLDAAPHLVTHAPDLAPDAPNLAQDEPGTGSPASSPPELPPRARPRP